MDDTYSEILEYLMNSGLPDDDLLPKIGDFGLRMQEKYETEGDLPALESSIVAFKKMLFILPAEDVNIMPAMGNLAISLAKRYDRVGSREDLEEAITIQRDYLCLSKQKGDMNGIRSALSNLGCSIRTRFEHFGDQHDLDEAIDLLDESMTLVSNSEDVSDGNTINNLAGALLSRFQAFGDTDALDKSIILFEDFLSMVPPGYTKSVALSNLSLALKEKIEYTGEANDFEYIIGSLEHALSELRPMQEGRSELLNNLGLTLKLKFRQFGHLEDLDRSIATLEEALQLDPIQHTNRGLSLNNLALSVKERYLHLEHLEDLNTAIALHEEALSLRPPGNSYRSSSLCNLAVALLARYDKQGRSDDLNQAINYEEEALSLRLPGQEGRIGSLNNLSHLLEEKFHESGDKDYRYLDEAILLREEALSYKSISHHDRYAVLSNLGNIYDTRFEHLKQKEDIDKAISFTSEAASSITRDDWNKAGALYNLAFALQRRFESFGGTEDLEEAIHIYMDITSAIATTPIRIAFNSSQQWAKLAHESSHHTALQAYRTAISLLSPVVSLTYDVHSRQRALNIVARGFASDAAYCAMQMHHYDIAIEMLETGRSIFWSQALETRSEVQRLAEHFPHLERRLKELSKALETASFRTNVTHAYNLNIEDALSKSREASHLVKLNDERNKILNEVRSIPGFEDFLQPLRFKGIKSASEKGYIVILNASRFGSCNALILAPNSEHVLHYELSQFSKISLDFVAFLMQLAKKCGYKGVDVSRVSTTSTSTTVSLGDADNVNNAPTSLRFGQKAAEYSKFDAEINFPSTLTAVLEWTWNVIVYPIIDFLGIESCEGPEMPRVWWYPTGKFTEVPLHAAGIYSGESQEHISDYVVSSYTSTLTTLQNTSQRNQNIDKLKMVAVADTTSLQATATELEHIKKHIPRSHFVEFGTSKSSPATTEKIVSHMTDASIVHFACHGRHIPDSPLHSYLQLSSQDQNLEISRIMQLSIPRASIAYLSACGTAVGDENLPDESLHIGASLIFAGFESVVATMWEIDDEDGPIVADAFYEYLFKGVDFDGSTVESQNQFDPTKSAEALHHAVKILRSRDVPPHRWVPFIHLGK